MNSYKNIDLNCDLGEWTHPKAYQLDKKIMPFISSCNIACGGHIGDKKSMNQTIQLALQHHVTIGAHPSYPDQVNFGRKSISIDSKTLRESLKHQIVSFQQLCQQHGAQLKYIKAHGALYNDIMQNPDLASFFIDIIKSIDPSLAIMVLAESPMLKIAKEKNIKCIQEGFSDRVYEQKNQLRSRKKEGAVLVQKTKILHQIERFLKQEVIDYFGNIHSLKVDSLCLHSDTKDAVNLAKDIHQYITNRNVSISSHC